MNGQIPGVAIPWPLAMKSLLGTHFSSSILNRTLVLDIGCGIGYTAFAGRLQQNETIGGIIASISLLK